AWQAEYGRRHHVLDSARGRREGVAADKHGYDAGGLDRARPDGRQWSSALECELVGEGDEPERRPAGRDQLRWLSPLDRQSRGLEPARRSRLDQLLAHVVSARPERGAR